MSWKAPLKCPKNLLKPSLPPLQSVRDDEMLEKGEEPGIGGECPHSHFPILSLETYSDLRMSDEQSLLARPAWAKPCTCPLDAPTRDLREPYPRDDVQKDDRGEHRREYAERHLNERDKAKDYKQSSARK